MEKQNIIIVDLSEDTESPSSYYDPDLKEYILNTLTN